MAGKTPQQPERVTQTLEQRMEMLRRMNEMIRQSQAAEARAALRSLVKAANAALEDMERAPDTEVGRVYASADAAMGRIRGGLEQVEQAVARLRESSAAAGVLASLAQQ